MCVMYGECEQRRRVFFPVCVGIEEDATCQAWMDARAGTDKK